MTATATPGENYPDPLEKIFLQVEEESERRARIEAQTEEALRREQQQQSQLQPQRDPSTRRPSSSGGQSAERARRRGSVSISRFGQLALEDASAPPPKDPSSPKRLSSTIFYQQQSTQSSTASFNSSSNNAAPSTYASQPSRTHTPSYDHVSDDEDADIEHDHVTQMHTIPPKHKNSISKAVGSLILKAPGGRRLSRVQSATNIIRSSTPVMGVNVGVNVQETTTKHEDEDGRDEGQRTTEIIGGGNGRRRMTVSGVVPVLPSTASSSGTAKSPPQVSQAPSSNGTVRSTQSSVSSGSQSTSVTTTKEKDFKEKSKGLSGFTQKFKRRSTTAGKQ